MQNDELFALAGFLWLIGGISSTPRRQFFYANNAHDLTNLAAFDLKLFKGLEAVKSTAALNSTSRKIINFYLKDFKDSNRIGRDLGSGSIDLLEVTGNPITVYRLIRRCTLMAPTIINETEVTKSGSLLTDRVNKFPLPTKQDVLEAIDGIINIQSYYRMNVTQFASGNIFGSIGPSSLRAVHCFEIGKRALKRGFSAAANHWLQEAKRLAQLNQAVEPDTFTPKEMNETTELGAREMIDQDKDRFKEESNHVPLCSGENLQTPREAVGHICWLEFKISAESRIGPLKMEFLSRNPPVVRIYNAFFPTDTENIRASAHTLTPSTILRRDKELIMAERSSSTTFMSPRIELSFRRKIGTLVGLNYVGPMDTAAPVQITSYTAGSYFACHHDHGYPEEYSTRDGDRPFMTVMTYLNTVDQGGYTVFPEIKTFAKPIKGSAIFWFNILSDGSADTAMDHMACPVIKGQKWVATIWIGMLDQSLKNQCLLRPTERFQVPVNGQVS